MKQSGRVRIYSLNEHSQFEGKILFKKVIIVTDSNIATIFFIILEPDLTKREL